MNYNQYYLIHHGILGQKWGIRRFQNPDGSLTKAGKKRYGSESVDTITNRKGLQRRLNDLDTAIVLNKKYAAEGLLKEAKLKEKLKNDNLSDNKRQQLQDKYNKAVQQQKNSTEQILKGEKEINKSISRNSKDYKVNTEFTERYEKTTREKLLSLTGLPLAILNPLAPALMSTNIGRTAGIQYTVKPKDAADKIEKKVKNKKNIDFGKMQLNSQLTQINQQQHNEFVRQHQMMTQQHIQNHMDMTQWHMNAANNAHIDMMNHFNTMQMHNMF